MILRSASRRRLIRAGGLVAVIGVFAPSVITSAAHAAEEKNEAASDKLRQAVGLKSKEDVTPPEDLMREHGVLDRVLLIYEAALGKFAGNETFDPEILNDATKVIREFIQDYHEQSEEHQVFPRFKQKGQLTDLVDTLLAQHHAGRRVIDVLLAAAPATAKDGDERRKAISAMRAFITMYRPHAAREDTDLFPKLKDMVSSSEYEAIAEDFEKEEHRKFGEDGFEKMAARVARLEQAIGINDLRQFTPQG